MSESFSRRIVMKKYLIGTFLLVSMVLPASFSGALTTDYTYDTAGRLARADYDINASITYDYDVNSNLVQRNVYTFELRGDINNNGAVDLEDVILGLQVLAEQNTTGISISGDVNDDQRIGMEEILYGLGKVAQGD